MMRFRPSHIPGCFQLIILVALMYSAPVFAATTTLPGHPKQIDRPRVQDGYHRPNSQHYSQGTSEGVHFRRNVPNYRYEVGRTIVKPGPHDSYVATGRGVIISSPGRAHHGHYYRSYRSYNRYPARSYWVPGHWETVYEQVWIPGHWEDRHVPAVYRKEFIDGRESLVLVQEERWERIWVEGRYETRQERVWIDGYWARY